MTSMSKCQKGTWAELRACAWLVEEGYDVFRNISPCGQMDVVAIKGATILRFDVKFKSSVKFDTKLKRLQIEAGILPLHVQPDGVCFIGTVTTSIN